MDTLISQMIQDLRSRSDDEEVVAYATLFMKACCGNSKHQPKKTIPEIVQWGMKLNDDDLYEAALNAGKDRHDVQQEVARIIENKDPERIDSEGFEAEDYDKW